MTWKLVLIRKPNDKTEASCKRPLHGGTLFKAMLTAAVVLMLRDRTVSQIGTPQPAKRAISVRTDTQLRDWPSSDSFLKSLVHVGFENKLPLGIVLEGDSLCRNRARDSVGTTTVGDLINQIETQLPDYRAEIREGAVFIHPRIMSASTSGTLDLVIPYFATRQNSAQGLAVSLWMYIRSLLVPKEGSAFVGGSQRNAELLEPFTVSNSSVRDILDRIISGGQGGIWVMREIPHDWQSNPKTIPYEVVSYSGDQQAADLINCSQRVEMSR